MLHARTLGVEQLEDRWLQAHAAELRAWTSMIDVHHDPRMTARTIGCARRVPAARQAMKRLSLASLVTLVRRYRDEYRSSLTSPGEALGIARALMGRRAKDRTRPRTGAPEGPLALEFGGRVTFELVDGTTVSGELSVPPGSLASPSFVRELEAKALRQLTPALGEAGARAAIDFVWSARDERVSALAARVARAPGSSAA
jgi:hypothetical protein